MKKSLFDIVQDYEQIMFKVEEQDGVLEEDDLVSLEINEEELEEKLRAYKHIIDKNNADIEYNKDEINRLRSRNNTREKSTKYLKNLVVNALHLYGNKAKSNFNLKYPDFTVFTKSNQSTEVETSSINTILTNLINGGFDTLTYNESQFIKDCGFILQDIGKIEVKVQFDVKTLLDYIEEIGYLDGATAEFKVDKKALKELNNKAEQLANDIESHPDRNWENEKEIVDRISDVMDSLQAEFNTSETAIFK